jgi:hypothetical protein
MDEITEAVLRLSLAFRRNGLSPPSIELGAREDVARLRALASRNAPSGVQFRPSMPHDKPEIVTEIAGLTVRGPATWRALRGGGIVAE